MSTTSTGSSSRPSGARAGGPRDLDPESARGVERALAELRVRPSRRLGQSFLHDPFVADAEAALVAEGGAGPVLEIGPGLGILTEALLRRGMGPVIVIERDRRFVEYLRRRFAGRVEVRAGDALSEEWPDCPTVTGNLPFSAATPLLERTFSARGPRAVFLLQREVAERLAAGPGSRQYGRLSIFAALYGRVQLFQPVPARSFTPKPRVDGQILTFHPRPGLLPVPSVPAFERMVRRLFSARRKQLKNLLPAVVPAGTLAGSVAQEAGWPADWARSRPEELPPEAYFRLASVLEPSPP